MAQLPDEPVGIVASALAIMSAAAFGIYRTWLSIRSDLRGDGEAAQARSARAAIVGELTGEVTRLSATVRELVAELDTERRLRHAAQAEAADLRLRVMALERRVAGMIGNGDGDD